MPFTPTQINKAKVLQSKAARDSAPQIRLVAGPGTGKSYAIEDRVNYLLSNNISPTSIFVVSFTRESARDLKIRINKACNAAGNTNVKYVSVSTLHSLALRVLQNAGILKRFSSSPSVLDNWELENIYDNEFSIFSGITPSRCEDVRREHEAFWCTGVWSPPNYFPPNPPISVTERQQFISFYQPRTSTYCCVLPGEIIRTCVDGIAAGTLNPKALLNIEHLIIDEYQDLNQCDQQFIDFLIQQGVPVFIAGDDDQSIYSFRFSSPSGIQSFHIQYPSSSSHILTDCFRCTPAVLDGANNLINVNQPPNRISKTVTSAYISSSPPVSGSLHLFSYSNDGEEARSIAQSCSSLIAAGIPANEILILLSNSRALSRLITQSLTSFGIPFRSPKTESFTDTDVGRFILAILRIIVNPNDYIAYRTLLGLQHGVGPSTCHTIADLVVSNSLNYINLFKIPIPQGIFNTRQINALNGVRSILSLISSWSGSDTLTLRGSSLESIIITNYGNTNVQLYTSQISHIPSDITLEELRDYLWSSNDEQEAQLLESIYSRLGLTIPPQGFKLPLVRLMTMHGSKGLSSGVVFIPGLENEILPGNKRLPYPGLVLESSRMLYVAITRARASCVISYANNRFLNGIGIRPVPSQFASQLGSSFISNSNLGLSNQQISQIVNDYNNL